MKVLLIGKIWPEPKSSAAGSRTLDILRALRAVHWEVHFACAAQKSEFSDDLGSRFEISTHSIELNHSSFDQWVSGLQPDIVLFDRYMTEEQFGWRVAQALPDCLQVIDTSDLHCLRHAREQALKSDSPLNLHNEISLREIAAIYRADLSLMIAEKEMQILSETFNVPNTLIAYWPFALPEPKNGVPPFEERNNFVMIGSFLHEPNWDAVQYCRKEIWPLIRKELPDAKLDVYGSYPPPKARQLDNDKIGFRVLGRADDAQTTLARYRVNLAPLRFGAGLKGKLADSFLSGTPSVASPIAVESMPGNFDWGSSVSTKTEEFAKTAIRIHEDKNAWEHAQACGYAIARNRFSEKEWMPKLPSLLSEAFEERDSRRSHNFVGQMLRHHQHRSTEFMSRWIEAKNSSQP
ncbi:glycosyltransferase [Pelagicoccus albus]|uniref:Glycosyltransferase n=1 Tax=Pelagicoccus albus TaxID=415222 RepID=A0A7X1B4K2_9BACT|nr:glycosyltransferase [Pelagicoccus albus]MBC2605304.1 glycosyltransferase [Pelagicoccus albus]